MVDLVDLIDLIDLVDLVDLMELMETEESQTVKPRSCLWLLVMGEELLKTRTPKEVDGCRAAGCESSSKQHVTSSTSGVTSHEKL